MEFIVNEKGILTGVKDCEENVVIPSIVDGIEVTSIRDGAFYRCENLTNITIPDNVKSIGYRAFYSCVKLENVNISDNVASIGRHAFSGCKNLKDITFPATCEVAEDAFD